MILSGEDYLLIYAVGQANESQDVLDQELWFSDCLPLGVLMVRLFSLVVVYTIELHARSRLNIT